VTPSTLRRVALSLVALAAATFAYPSSATAAGTPTWWKPAKGLSWQWQLSGKLDLTVPVNVYDLDAVTTTATQVATLHKAGRRVVCYVDVGSYETYRTDAKRFPTAVLGATMDGWPDERWLDIRRWDVLKPILADRFDVCRQKGFDAVEPDNVDGYTNDTGFPLTAGDQLTFNRRIASLAHGLGLAVGLKNDLDQVATLAPRFDFAVNESCAEYDECDMLRPFVKAAKPVFHAEYGVSTAAFCPESRSLGLSSIRKRLALNAWRQTC
jgi:hypothetical protein